MSSSPVPSTLAPDHLAPDPLARLAWTAACPCQTWVDRVPWPQLVRGLQLVWRTQVSSADPLEPRHLACLVSKLRWPGQVGEDFEVTWQQFQGQPLAPYTFTFWQWFFGAVRLTRDHMVGPWRKGLVLGFVAKQEGEALLALRPQGTFLLRFSDSILGGISIAYSASQGVVHVAPLEDCHLRTRGLVDTIFDLYTRDQEIRTLFPATPLHAFAEFRSPQSLAAEGYVSFFRRRELATQTGNEPQTTIQYPKNITTVIVREPDEAGDK